MSWVRKYFILILSLTPLDGHPFKNLRRRQRNRQREIEKDFPLWLLIYRQRTDRDVSSSPPVYSCLNLNNFGFCFCYTPDTYKNCLPLGFHNSGLSSRFSTKIESLNPLLWRFVGCRRHTHRRWFRGSFGAQATKQQQKPSMKKNILIITKKSFVAGSYKISVL